MLSQIQALARETASLDDFLLFNTTSLRIFLTCTSWDKDHGHHMWHIPHIDPNTPIKPSWPPDTVRCWRDEADGWWPHTRSWSVCEDAETDCRWSSEEAEMWRRLRQTPRPPRAPPQSWMELKRRSKTKVCFVWWGQFIRDANSRIIKIYHKS